MSRGSDYEHCFVSAQQRMLRIAERDYGLTPLQIEAETGIPKRTVMSWRASDASAISGPSLVKLAACLPNHLLSLLTEPSGKVFADAAPDAQQDMGALLREGSALIAAIGSALAAANGTSITPQAKASIADIARRVAPLCSAVAA